VAGFDYGRALQVARWPLREMLIAYVARIREQTEESYRHAQLLYQVRNSFGGKEQPPPVPPLLREPQRK
jgi:hypothetical protein